MISNHGQDYSSSFILLKALLWRGKVINFWYPTDLVAFYSHIFDSKSYCLDVNDIPKGLLKQILINTNKNTVL